MHPDVHVHYEHPLLHLSFSRNFSTDNSRVEDLCRFQHCINNNATPLSSLFPSHSLPITVHPDVHVQLFPTLLPPCIQTCMFSPSHSPMHPDVHAPSFPLPHASRSAFPIFLLPILSSQIFPLFINFFFIYVYQQDIL